MDLLVSFFSKLVFLMEIRVKAIGVFSAFLSYCKIMCHLLQKPSPDHLGRGRPSFLLRPCFFVSFPRTPFLGLTCNLSCSFQWVLTDYLSPVPRIQSP